MKDVMSRALMAHAAIKSKLIAAILEPGNMASAEMRSDRTCEFGLWLYGAGEAEHAGRPEFEALKTTHRRFHHAAAKALCECQAGRKDVAEHSIQAGAFNDLSREMQDRLIQMKAVLQCMAVD